MKKILAQPSARALRLALLAALLTASGGCYYTSTESRGGTTFFGPNGVEGGYSTGGSSSSWGIGR
ncbi:MAG: hypothetical protein HY608_01425 [Planctomycetes bacterium]|nr:hypothetical protein [Planctomycetota bacterium]